MTDRLELGDTNPFRSLRQRAQAASISADEFCDFCSEPLAANHRHLLNVSSREIQCACRACVILFDHTQAGGGTRRLVPTGVRYLPDFQMSDGLWESLRIPVNMAFFTRNSAAGRVMALYPGPMGPTESLLSLDAWDDLEVQNPVLQEMQEDVEALLVNRTYNARDHFLVPIDECYKLVGLIRAYWRGLSGGKAVWQEIEHFFDALKQRSQTPGGRRA